MDVGVRLRESREARGLSLERLSQTTRIKPQTLAALERNDLSAIPPGPFARGFVRAYAAEVGLDPEQTVREYFANREVPTIDPSIALTHDSDAGESRAWIGAAAIACLVVLAASALVFLRSPAPGATSEPQAVGTAGQDRAPAALASSPPSTPVPASRAAAESAPVSIAIVTTEPAWISATADGRRLLYRTLAPGEHEIVTGSREVRLRIGNAGGVRLTINGREVPNLGRSGQVRTLRITPENAAAVVPRRASLSR